MAQPTNQSNMRRHFEPFQALMSFDLLTLTRRPQRGTQLLRPMDPPPFCSLAKMSRFSLERPTQKPSRAADMSFRIATTLLI
jgi:hypothetical protein